MKKQATKSKSAKGVAKSDDQIAAYAHSQRHGFRSICNQLRELIDAALPKATSKIWHGSPVWFIDENPVVGYNAAAKSVNLLFWNGKAFGEPALKPVGKYWAAQALFGDASEVYPTVILRWLKKAKSDIFDSKAFFKKLRNSSKGSRQID